MDKCAVQHISSQATFSQLHTLNNLHLRHKGTLEIIKIPENNNIFKELHHNSPKSSNRVCVHKT